MDRCSIRRVHGSSDSLIIRAHHTMTLFPPRGALKTSPLNFFYSSSSFRFGIIMCASSYFPDTHSRLSLFSHFSVTVLKTLKQKLTHVQHLILQLYRHPGVASSGSVISSAHRFSSARFPVTVRL